MKPMVKPGHGSGQRGRGRKGIADRRARQAMSKSRKSIGGRALKAALARRSARGGR